MRRIRSRDTSPELTVRRFLHRAGFRYRLHAKSLPGKPDVVLPALRACVLIHGCFWHGCSKCVDGTRRVKSRSDVLDREDPRKPGARSATHSRRSGSLGWKVYVLWECELRGPAVLQPLARSLEKASGAERTAGEGRLGLQRGEPAL